jgi:hypothetical protein
MVLSRKIKNSELDNFKAKFVEKFENQEMPLSLVLDGEFADIDHLIPAQTDHRFRAKLTTQFRGKLTTLNGQKML